MPVGRSGATPARASDAGSAGFPRLGGAKLSDRLAAELERRILSGEPGAGERLPTEAELCDLFGVSRTVVRDALRTLVARGLVRVGPGQGIVVTNPGDEAFGEALLLLLARSGLTMREVTEARAAIEVHLAPLAAERGTDADWDRMDEHLARFADAVDARDSRRAHRAHLDFHLALLHAIHLPALEILLTPMQEIIMLSSVPPTTDDPILWDVPAHPPILEALRARDGQRTRAALDEHFLRFLDDERYAAFEATPFGEAALEARRLLHDGGRSARR